MKIKFKPGDKVLILSSLDVHIDDIKQMIGKVCEVCEHDEILTVWNLKHTSIWSFNPDRVRLVETLDEKKLVEDLSKKVIESYAKERR